MSSARGAISYANPGDVYSQNFDSYAGSTGAVAFTNDSTIPGFYAYLSGTTSTTTVPAGAPDVVYRGATTSTAAAGASTVIPSGTSYPFYLYEPTATPTNVSFGTYNTDGNSQGVGTGYLAYGFEFENDTGVTLTSFSFTYTALAPTKTAYTNADPVTFSYAVNATGVSDTSGAYVVAPALGYSTSAAGVLTGPTDSTVTGITVLPGDTLWVRFRDGNVGSTDRYTQTDNIFFSAAVPEPATLGLAAIAGLGVLRRTRRDGR